MCIRDRLKGKPSHILDRPPGIETLRIDPYTGKRSNGSGAIYEYFMQPFVPGQEVAPVEQGQQPQGPTPIAEPVEQSPMPADVDGEHPGGDGERIKDDQAGI